ncbi:MAG: hybrid sensor histidine kinase/response regulator [Cryomorphaceae bacterium]|nr:hybrid sensor histidine kinase/response regulator [Cryomorphaceae bacterium]
MKEDRICVLYLDDEVNNLRSFKAALRRDYHVLVAETPDEAFKLLEEEHPQIVFSDQRMPEMTGVEFFQRIRETHPEVIRILLTGYADIENVVEAINKGHVYRYLTKPWNEDDIRFAIENGAELYRTRLNLKAKMESLQRTNEELNRFIYSTSHDLRAPIATSLGIVNVAEMEINDKLSLEYFEIIKESLLRIDGYIKNILNYYRNNRFETTLNKVNVKEVIDEVLDSLRATITLHKANINIDIDEQLEWSLDDFRLRIILNNLLSNAVNFKRENVELIINISVKVENDVLTVSVTDNGMGIEEEVQSKIFKMFFRGTHKVYGTGLGLYIVKEAVREMNGAISLTSNKEQGTSFIVTLPKN